MSDKTPSKNDQFAAGYHVLAAAEAFLQEAPADVREYGKGWYLTNLLKMERLLDALRPGHTDVGKKNFDIYDKKEQSVRQKISQFADTLDPDLKQTIISSMTCIEEQVEDLPSGRKSGLDVSKDNLKPPANTDWLAENGVEGTPEQLIASRSKITSAIE